MKTEADDQVYPTPYGEVYNGLTKREYFAGLAMQGIMADAENATLSDGTARGAGQYLCLNEGEYNFTEHYPALVAKSAVAYADALIAQLNKERQ